MPPPPTTLAVSQVRAAAGAALAEPDREAKAAAVHALARQVAAAVAAGGLDPTDDVGLPLVPVDQPGRGHRPVLVPPRELPARRLTDVAGRVAAVHAVAHIEANAVDLALDASHRFAGLPAAYHADWVAVAAEEATHLALLRGRLRALGADYGDLPAHDGLWQAAVRTGADVLRRMALVPRVLEARGLDVSPAMRDRFAGIGDHGTADVLQRILDDEVGHVAVGDRWFRWCCAQRGLAPEPTFRHLLAEAGVRVVPPLNVEARRAAGFSAAELADLGAQSAPGPAGPRH